MTTPMSLKPYDKFSSISNKTMVAIFPNVCLWRRSYAQNWDVLTLKNCYSIEPPSYASTAYVVASYGPRFLSTVSLKVGQLARIFWANSLPPPLAKNCPYAYGYSGSLYRGSRFHRISITIGPREFSQLSAIKFFLLYPYHNKILYWVFS